MKKSILIILMSLAIVWGAGPAVQAGIIGPELNAVLQSLGPDEEVAVIVSLADKADLKKIKDLDKAQKRSKIIKALKDKADKTQKDLIKFLEQKKAKKVVSYWVFNGLAATVKAGDIAELAGRPEVEKVSLDGKIKAPEPTAAPSAAPEWNLSAIRAPELWASGYTGEGVVVANMDTGVDANHSDLAGSFRGGDNSWFDPNGEYATPHDNTGHGTQVMGLMVGGDAGGTAIGVAPGARWIAVKIFDSAGAASLSDIHDGFQWLLDPDDDPDTDDAPDVVNNSWSLPETVGQCYLGFEPDIEALKAAEIAVVFSGGNRGTLGSESPANNPASFAVGATDITDTIAYFSSIGPSDCDGGVYPNVVAPGVGVKTSDLGDWYAWVIGTSFAAPHVSGAMALLLSAYPGATVGQLEQALEETALDLGAAGPDDAYGYGLIDVVAAEGWLADLPPGPVCTDEIKHDGIDQDCNGYDLTIDIIKADYTANRDILAVEATSALGKDAGLELTGYGSMSWDRKKAKWKITVRGAGGDPGMVTVSGIEGAENAPTISDGGDEPVGVEGKGDTCSDGLDNDGDGQTDCDDSGCSKNKACK